MGIKSRFPGILKLSSPWNVGMGFFEQFRADHLQRFSIDLYRMVAAHEAQITGNHGMLSWQTIAFCGYVNEGIYNYRPVGNLLPNGCRRFYQFLLENLIFDIPQYL